MRSGTLQHYKYNRKDFFSKRYNTTIALQHYNKTLHFYKSGVTFLHVKRDNTTKSTLLHYTNHVTTLQ